MPNPSPQRSRVSPVPHSQNLGQLPEISRFASEAFHSQLQNPLITEPERKISTTAKVVITAIAVTALRAAVSWFTSRRFPAKPTPVLQIVPVDHAPVQAGDVLLDLAPTDLTAFSCHLTSDEVNLGQLYLHHKERVTAAVGSTVAEYFGHTIAPIVALQPGSLRVNIVARVKNAWNSTGNRANVTDTGMRYRINLSELMRRLVAVLVELAKALWEAVTSPEFKIVAKGTYKVVRGMISLAAAIAPLLEFFGFAHATDVLAWLQQHLPNA